MKTDEDGAGKLLFQYNEDKILDEVKEYIAGTYSEHYGDQKIQIQDVFDQMGISEAFTRGAAIKYLFRFGKNYTSYLQRYLLVFWVMILLGIL